tara:strand:+ start:140 stop:445 length:306 start_codon:yes stop_codon:yes gene_type:complete
MAKASSVQKNILRQKLIEKFKEKRNNLKNKIRDKNISIEDRIKFQNKLNDLPRNSSSIRYRNRCKLTGRARGNYRKFGLSRIKVRELSMTGDLPGMIKSSW